MDKKTMRGGDKTGNDLGKPWEDVGKNLGKLKEKGGKNLGKLGGGGKTGNDLGKMWARSGKDPGSRSDVGIFRKYNGNKYGHGWRKVRAFVKQANTWSKCFAMGWLVIF